MSNPINKEEFNMSNITAALNTVDKTAILNALKGAKLGNIFEKLPPKVQKRVEVLKQIQSEHDELEAKFLEERRALEDKYQKLYQPLYAKRYDIVNGVVEVDGVSNEPETDKGADAAAEEKGVPNFWLNALKTNEVLAESIQDRDAEALKYLKDIKWSRVELSKDDTQKGEATKGFKLDFFFDPNPYFTNSVLTKTYYMIDEDDPTMEKATGTVIDWCAGKCLTQKILRKKPKKGKNAKPITKTETVESFFNFFSPPEVPEDDEEIDEDALEELQNLMEQDYDIGSTIRDKIIPHAVSWFTGEAAEDDEFGDLDDDDIDDDDDEEDDDDEDDDEEEDDEEEDDDNEDDKGNKKKRATKAVGGAQQTGEKPPECKQQ